MNFNCIAIQSWIYPRSVQSLAVHAIAARRATSTLKGYLKRGSLRGPPLKNPFPTTDRR